MHIAFGLAWLCLYFAAGFVVTVVLAAQHVREGRALDAGTRAFGFFLWWVLVLVVLYVAMMELADRWARRMAAHG